MIWLISSAAYRILKLNYRSRTNITLSANGSNQVVQLTYGATAYHHPDPFHLRHVRSPHDLLSVAVAYGYVSLPPAMRLSSWQFPSFTTFRVDMATSLLTTLQENPAIRTLITTRYLSRRSWTRYFDVPFEKVVYFRFLCWRFRYCKWMVTDPWFDLLSSRILVLHPN